jgi:hypothetical protein
MASSVEAPRAATTNVAGFPLSMAARLKANACGPRNAVPAALKTFIDM